MRKLPVARRDAWRCFVMVAWDSGLRLGDLFELRSELVRGQSRFQLVQHKTGKPLLVKLRPETVQAMEATYPPIREYLFRGLFGRPKFYVRFRKLCDQAGLFCKGPGLGLSRMLRRSAATAVERAAPGSAMRFLGHTSPGPTYAHYVDFSQLDDPRPLVPSLLGTEQTGFMLPPSEQISVTPNAPGLDDVEAMLKRVLAQTNSAPQPAASQSAGGLPSLLVLRDFLSSAGVAGTSVGYRESLSSYIRQAIEDCRFDSTCNFSGEMLVAWLRHRLAAGLSASRVSWARHAWIRFLKWVASSKPSVPQVLECLGALYAADDMHKPSQKGGVA
jgi:hypothetical protein